MQSVTPSESGPQDTACLRCGDFSVLHDGLCSRCVNLKASSEDRLFSFTAQLLSTVVVYLLAVPLFITALPPGSAFYRLAACVVIAPATMIVAVFSSSTRQIIASATPSPRKLLILGLCFCAALVLVNLSPQSLNWLLLIPTSLMVVALSPGHFSRDHTHAVLAVLTHFFAYFVVGLLAVIAARGVGILPSSRSAWSISLSTIYLVSFITNLNAYYHPVLYSYLEPLLLWWNDPKSRA